MPILDERIELALCKAMLALHSPLTRKAARALKNGDLHIKTKPFTGFSALKCRAQLRQLQLELSRMARSQIHDFVREQAQLPPTEAFLCPQGHDKDASYFDYRQAQRST
eukprot:66018-Karenia_brevis.AAC.1